jgi:hypothetical protein
LDSNAARLGPPELCDLGETEISAVHNEVEILEVGTIRPVDFQLRDDGGADFPL